MKGVFARRLLAAIFGAILVAALAVYFFGDSGLLAYRDLNDYHIDLAANVRDLQDRNAALKAELMQLQTDPDRNTVLAHGIGLYASGEAVIRLEGRQPHAQMYAVGDLLSMKKAPENRNALLKTSALIIICLMLAYFSVASRQARRKAHAGQRR